MFYPLISKESFEVDHSLKTISYEKWQKIGKMSFIFDVVSYPTHSVARAWVYPPKTLVLSLSTPVTPRALYELYLPPIKYPQECFKADALSLAEAVKGKFKLKGAII